VAGKPFRPVSGPHAGSVVLAELARLWEQAAHRVTAGEMRPTQQRLASESGVPDSTINSWSTGTTLPRHLDQLTAVGKVLNRWAGEKPQTAREWDQLLRADQTAPPAAPAAAYVSERTELALQRLGSDKPAIRVSAVHALAEIAVITPGERPRIAEILTTHLRSETPGPGPDGDSTYLLPPLRVRLPVAQAIMTVLANGQFRDLDLSYADLCGANLANRDLREADLRKVNLRCADLTMADLTGADLRGANLTGAKVAGALLAGVQVMDACLTEMDLTEVDLSEVVLVRVDMSRSKLAGVDLSGRDDLHYSRFRDADLTGANLGGAELRGAQFPGAKLHNADLTRARMVKANLKGATLDGTRMSYADLAKADLTRAWLEGTALRGAMLQEADLTGAYLIGTDLRGASLLDANLSRTNMRNVRIDRHTRDQGKLRYRSPSEVHMEEDNPDDDPLTSTP
jgi:uncharacterized protein YjbI with pentapeptide repeats